MDRVNIGFVGGGNMTQSMVAGLVAQGFSPTQCFVADRNEEKRQLLEAEFKVNVSSDASSFIDECQVVVLSVKPQSMGSTLQGLREGIIKAQPLIITVAAGISIDAYPQMLTSEVGVCCNIIRAMPNTPTKVQQGATGLLASPTVTELQKETATSLFKALGLVVWVEEEFQLEAVMAVSGCGPAYYFLFTDYLATAGMKLGLTEDVARQLAVQTAQGAAEMMQQSDESLLTLRQQVAAKGGSTEQALQVFQQQGLQGLIEEAMQAALSRGQELSQMLKA